MHGGQPGYYESHLSLSKMPETEQRYLKPNFLATRLSKKNYKENDLIQGKSVP